MKSVLFCFTLFLVAKCAANPELAAARFTSDIDYHYRTIMPGCDEIYAPMIYRPMTLKRCDAITAELDKLIEQQNDKQFADLERFFAYMAAGAQWISLFMQFFLSQVDFTRSPDYFFVYTCMLKFASMATTLSLDSLSKTVLGVVTAVSIAVVFGVLPWEVPYKILNCLSLAGYASVISQVSRTEILAFFFTSFMLKENHELFVMLIIMFHIAKIFQVKTSRPG